jgi:small conductance mechanosensitive channel
MMENQPVGSGGAAPAGADSVGDAVTKQLGTLSKMWDEAVGWLTARGPGIVAALVILVLAWIVAGVSRRLVIKAMTRAHIDLTLAKFFGTLTKWGIIVFAVVTCMGTLGINTTSLAAVVGAAGLAIGLALQGNLGNLAAGVLLLIFRPFKIGDAVIVAGQAGIVDGIDLFTTNLDTPDNRRITVPNNAIFSGVIENQSRHPRRRVDVTVPVGAGAKIDDVQRVLMEAAEKVVGAVEGALRDTPPAAVMTELAPPTWCVSIWAETGKFAPVRLALVRELKLAVDGAKIGPTPPVTEVRVTALPEQLATWSVQAPVTAS